MQDSIFELCRDHYSLSKLEAYLNYQPSKIRFEKLMGDQIIIVATQNVHGEPNKLVGFSRFDPAHALLESLCVLPQFSRQGIGRSLLRYIEDVARSLKLPEVSVHSSLNAIVFYQRCGYRQQDLFYLQCNDGKKIESVRFTKTF